MRFAELYVDPAHGNYDPVHRIIRRPHNGTDPGRAGLFDGPHYPWLTEEAKMLRLPARLAAARRARPCRNATRTRG